MLFVLKDPKAFSNNITHFFAAGLHINLIPCMSEKSLQPKYVYVQKKVSGTTGSLFPFNAKSFIIFGRGHASRLAAHLCRSNSTVEVMIERNNLIMISLTTSYI